jgi:pimeloyl-ACP methyl ester carboxylesterase
MLEYPWQVGDTFTRVLEAGRDGVPTVLLHGVGARADRWRQNLEPFAEAGLHVYALDLPGHGFAAKGHDFGDYSVDGYAAFVKQFLESVAAERAVVVGTSLGGHVGAKLTCEAPDRIAALVMVGALGLIPLGEQSRAQLAASLSDTSERGVRGKLERVIDDTSSITDDWVTAESRINSSGGADLSFAALGAYFRDRLDDDLVTDCLLSLDPCPPMLLIWGSEDPIVPRTIGEQASDLLGPGVPLRTIGSTGHAPYLEAPTEFNEMVLSFLRETSVLTK